MLNLNMVMFASATIEIQAFVITGLLIWMLIILCPILVIVFIIIFTKFGPLPKWMAFARSALGGIITGKGVNNTSIYETIKAAGYSYDSKQDIFYSNMDPWQRKHGYSRFFDESAAIMGMIVDCEPIRFDYGGKKWLIELWKGQYDMTTGGEIGVYTAKGTDVKVKDVLKAVHYDSASDEDRLPIAFALKKKGKTIFVRRDIHWWLTGFKLGEYSEPSDLVMNINITLKDEAMRDTFIEALMNIGYTSEEIFVHENIVGLVFDRPHTKQPVTRTAETDKLIQKKNKLLCDSYNEITGPYITITEKIRAIQKESPELYKYIANIGKPKQLFQKRQIGK